MKTKVQAAGGYAKVQAVKMIEALVSHFNMPPRMFIGSNDTALYRIWQRCMAQPTYRDVTEFIDEDDPDDPDQPKREAEKRFSSWDDEGPIQKRGGWDDDDEKNGFVVPPPRQSVVTVKETPRDQTMSLCRKLMIRYQAHNMSEMFAILGKLPSGVDEQYKSLWRRLSVKHGMSNIMNICLENLKADVQLKSFAELVEEYCKAPNTLPDKEYETPESSYKVFVKWCKKNKIDLVEFINSIIDVMDKVEPKINTVCLVGPSNAGKTVMFSNPLCKLARFVGQIGNRGNESPFLYQDCVNCRVIKMDECVMDPLHYEDLKLLMGGEDMKVQVKHQSHATLQRTPVLMTGNKPPWLLDYSAKEPMLNRMHYYEVETDEDLKDVKLMHPGMWWYLRQQYHQDIKPLSFSKLVKYPQVQVEEVDSTDPLD